jgi:hypothetical protein
MSSFHICIYPSGNSSDGVLDEMVRDFGYSSSAYDFIYPIGLESIGVSNEQGTEAWCTSVSYSDVTFDSDGTVRLFPIYRVVDYGSLQESTVSYDTKCMMYTLGVCYSILFFLFLFCLVSSTFSNLRFF